MTEKLAKLINDIAYDFDIKCEYYCMDEDYTDFLSDELDREFGVEFECEIEDLLGILAIVGKEYYKKYDTFEEEYDEFKFEEDMFDIGFKKVGEKYILF